MPEEATPLQRAEQLAALSVGTEIRRLRPVARWLGLDANLESALAAVAQGHSAVAIARFNRLDEAFALHSENELDALRRRTGVLVISEALAKHAAYFDAGALR